jgi:hypothetical protein
VGGGEVNLSIQIGKLTLQNPVTVASGTFGYGVEYARLLDLNLLGAVVVKGIRLHPVPGNPTPRTAEVTSCPPIRATTVWALPIPLEPATSAAARKSPIHHRRALMVSSGATVGSRSPRDPVP